MGNNTSKSIDNQSNVLNIFIYGTNSQYLEHIKDNKNIYDIVEDNIEYKHKKYKWFFKFYQSDKLETMKNDIKTNIENSKENNVILLILDSKEDTKIKSICDLYSGQPTPYLPEILFAFKIKGNNLIDKNSICKDNFDNDLINQINIINYNYFEDIELKLNEICCYLNNIGDIVLYPDVKFNQDLNCFKYYSGKNNKYKGIFSIIFIGKKGSCKSTLINILLGKKRAREGFLTTPKITNYLHDEYPLLLHDTPGFEDKDLEKMKSYFSDYQNLFNKGKYKFDLVLYLINASNSRFFSKSEIELIKSIYKMQLPIFFVCTKSKTEEYAKDYEEIIKLGLKRNFDEGTAEKLIEKKIFSCHLKDEKDISYKKFGIDKLFKGIYEYFKNYNLSRDDLDLENKKEEIIDQYQKYSSEIKNNDNSFLKDLEQIFRNHMKFEMNFGEESNEYENKDEKKKEIEEDESEKITDEDCLFSFFMKLNKKDKEQNKSKNINFKSVFDDLKNKNPSFLNNQYIENTNTFYKNGINFFNLSLNKNFK